MKAKEVNFTSPALNRRRFIRNSGIGLAGAAMTAGFPNIITARAAPDDPIRIGVIGCGGRGTGAALDALKAATDSIYPAAAGYHTEDAKEGAVAMAKNVSIMALADVFPDRLQRCREQIKKVGIEVAEEYCFTGFDAYQKLLAIPEINYVMLATPPHFRPMHLRAAVEAGKHVFMEKPVAVDVAGVRSVIESGEIAAKKGLTIGAGTQRRYDNTFQEAIARIHSGEIGEIRSGISRWLLSEMWFIERQPGWTDMEAQLRNWMYYNWLSGDIFVEQFIHSIDMVNWVVGAHPTKAIGLGGRQVRTDPKFGNIYDHFSVQYEYPGDVTIFCLDRQMNGTASRIDDAIIGSKGRANFTYMGTSLRTLEGQAWRFRGETNNPYQAEHDAFIAAIRSGQPINEARQIAESTMTAIIGREAVYSGQEIEWDAAMKSPQDFTLKEYKFGELPVDPVPMPGKYKFV